MPSRPRKPPRAASSLSLAFAIFLIGCLVSGWLSVPGLAGFGFAAGAIVAAGSVRRQDLLSVVVAPPGLFLIAVAIAELITARLDQTPLTAGSAAAAGLLTLSAAAPWLFGGVGAALVLATVRGLPECVRQLRADLAGTARQQADQAAPGGATGETGRLRPARASVRAAKRK